MLKERLTRAVKDALAICRAEDLVPDVGVPIEIVAQEGAYATNAALLLARRSENTSGTTTARAGVYAEYLAENINAHPDAPAIAQVSETGTLFLHPTTAIYTETVQAIQAAGDSWGTNSMGLDNRVLVEFVSANPNTPISLQHARGAVIGDAICRILAACRYTVDREFYVNDATSAPQLRALSRAVFAAYREKLGVSTSERLSEGYAGEYITELASKIVETSQDRYKDLSPEAAATALTPLIVSLMQTQQAETLSRFGVQFDRWFSESTLLASGALQKVMDTLLTSGSAYAHGGALWLKTTQFGDDSDRVLLRNDGTPSYYAGDLAYHADKLQTRAYDLAVDVWNADHQPYIGRTVAGLAALGIPHIENRLRIAVFGSVRAVQDGSELRTGHYASGMVTLHEILEAGADADSLRFALLSALPAQAPMDIPVDSLMVSAPNNPLAAIRAAIHTTQSESAISDADLGELNEKEALCEVIRRLDMFPDVVKSATVATSPSEIARYVTSLSEAIHRLPDTEKTQNKAILDAAGITLRNALRLLGVSV